MVIVLEQADEDASPRFLGSQRCQSWPIRAPQSLTKLSNLKTFAVETGPGSNLALVSWGHPVHCPCWFLLVAPFFCQAFKCTIEYAVRRAAVNRVSPRRKQKEGFNRIPWGQISANSSRYPIEKRDQALLLKTPETICLVPLAGAYKMLVGQRNNGEGQQRLKRLLTRYQRRTLLVANVPGWLPRLAMLEFFGFLTK